MIPYRRYEPTVRCFRESWPDSAAAAPVFVGETLAALVAAIVQKLRLPAFGATIVSAHGILLGFGIGYATPFRQPPVPAAD